MTRSLHMFVLTALAAKQQPRPGDWSFGWTSVAAIGAVAVVIITCIWLAISYLKARRQRESNSPWRLFTELCSIHRLTRRQRHVLKRLARQYELSQPAMLFVEPKWWEAEQLGPTWVRHLPELRRLRIRLFSRR